MTMTKTSMRTFLFTCAAFLGTSGCFGVGGIEVTVRGPGQVRSNPAGIDCNESGGDCAAQIGESYILSAVANAGAHFDHWEGDELCTESARTTVVISRGPKHTVACTAVFADGAATADPNAL